MHRAKQFFSNLTGQKVSETRGIKEKTVVLRSRLPISPTTEVVCSLVFRSAFVRPNCDTLRYNDHQYTHLGRERNEKMDKIKGLFNDLTGGDGKVDSSDIKAQIGDLGVDDLKDLTFPITKAEVLETLRTNGSSDLLIQAVEKVPQDTFDSLNDLKAKLPI